jgi:hypothetical protein
MIKAVILLRDDFLSPAPCHFFPGQGKKRVKALAQLQAKPMPMGMKNQCLLSLL